MNPEHAKVMLLEKLQILESRLRNLKHDRESSHSADFEDQAQERENDEVADALGLDTQKSIKSIRQVLQLIANGQYGLCQSCGDCIDDKRLDAWPEAMFCIDCAL